MELPRELAVASPRPGVLEQPSAAAAVGAPPGVAGVDAPAQLGEAAILPPAQGEAAAVQDEADTRTPAGETMEGLVALPAVAESLQPPQPQPQQEESGPITAFSRPGYVGRPGYVTKSYRRRLPRIFPSSWQTNTQRSEALFKSHYGKEREQAMLAEAAAAAAAAAASAANEQQQQQQRRRARRLQQAVTAAVAASSSGEQAAATAAAASSAAGGDAAAAHPQQAIVSGEGRKAEEQALSQSQPQQHQHQQSTSRRSTRSSGLGLDDWIKIPVSATVRVRDGTFEELDGWVFLSVETARLFRQGGQVFFETKWRGSPFKAFVPDRELPMISEDHPAFKEEASRAENERTKKLAQARHMLELVRANMEAAYDMECKAADRTLELRRKELRERMLERAEDTLERLREELQEEEAIERLETMRGLASAQEGKGQRKRQRDEDLAEENGRIGNGGTAAHAPPSTVGATTPAAAAAVVHEPQRELTPEPSPLEVDAGPRPSSSLSLVAAGAEEGPASGGGGAKEGADCFRITGEQGQEGDAREEAKETDTSEAGRAESTGAAMEATPPATIRTREGEEEIMAGQPAGKRPRTRRKITAADLAVYTLATAADVAVGLKEVSLVRDADYEDIHDVTMDKLHPREDYGEDEDLILS